jgi:hypothetical protein
MAVTRQLCGTKKIKCGTEHLNREKTDRHLDIERFEEERARVREEKDPLLGDRSTAKIP